jgi:hypothetical protein
MVVLWCSALRLLRVQPELDVIPEDTERTHGVPSVHWYAVGVVQSVYETKRALVITG